MFKTICGKLQSLLSGLSNQHNDKEEIERLRKELEKVKAEYAQLSEEFNRYVLYSDDKER